MNKSFDTIINRRGTDCVKYDCAAQFGIPEDALPMWVADMDFAAPQSVLQALHDRVDHGIFGYPGVQADYAEAVRSWFQRRFDWTTETEWIVRTPGVVFALAMAVRAYTQPGEAVLIQPPVYHPFFSVIQDNGRRVVENPLKLENGRYEIDFEGFEAAVVRENVRMFILCSPHNPVGRVWTAEELKRMGDICRRHGVIVASDEIHCDFTGPEHPHTPFIKAVPEMAERVVVCTAPSKTFNLAGLQASNIFVPGVELRRALTAEINRCGLSEINNLGLTACKAAYLTGDEWLDALWGYLRRNLDVVRRTLAEELPMLQLIEPEGTYLAWVDFSGLNLTPGALHDLVANRARLWLDDGGIFGKQGAQFQRFVLACPRTTVEEAMRRLVRAVRG